MVLGSPGGSTIIATVLNILVNILDFGMAPEEAVRAPRIVNRDGPTELETELFHDVAVKAGLEAKGHVVTRNPFFGNAQVLFRPVDKEEWTGVSDPRGEGLALGV
jgi:gamma-glutamyltranspeptidase/glutathione hydrolase